MLDMIETPQRAADEAVARVDRNADPEWMAQTLALIKGIPTGRRFTTDHIWHMLDEMRADAPHEPRAMGAVMRRAQTLGIIRSTGDYRKSDRVECHGRPVAIWERL